MKFENTEVWGFEHALRGMRNAKESWNKNDSYYDDNNNYVIGPNDMKLASSLVRAGPEHRKFLRQIFVSVDITASIFWLKLFDTYKIGTVANSTSTMHKVQAHPIDLSCFETDDFNEDLIVFDKEPYEYDNSIKDVVTNYLSALESIRNKYNETKDKKYWKELIRWLPCGWLQKRTVTMNYENLLAMCSKGQRRYHKLNEWSGIDKSDVPNFIAWARTLPYAKEFIFYDEEN